MPIYEYECTCCASRFELKRGFAENTAVSCPHCGCAAQRIFSSVPIIFKGSGFYVTDSRGNYGPPSNGGGAGEAKSGSATGEAKSGSATGEAKSGSATGEAKSGSATSDVN